MPERIKKSKFTAGPDIGAEAALGTGRDGGMPRAENKAPY
jgi:hypothetical protein